MTAWWSHELFYCVLKLFYKLLMKLRNRFEFKRDQNYHQVTVFCFSLHDWFQNKNRLLRSIILHSSIIYFCLKYCREIKILSQFRDMYELLKNYPLLTMDRFIARRKLNIFQVVHDFHKKMILK